MTYPPQEPPQQPQHAAAAYYPVPAHAPDPPKELTTLGVLAFSTAALATLFTCVDATVVGRAIRHGAAAEEIDTLDWSVAIYALGSVLTALSLLAGWVTGSMWLYRARKNAEVLEPRRHHARRAGWAWGGWICPIVSFWFPFQVVRDVHRATSPLRPSATVGWWWALFLLMLVGRRISDVESDATTADASGAQGVAIFFAVVMVVALGLWGLLLHRITKDQHERIHGGRPTHQMS